jgi:hypothetical protein
VLRGTHHEPEPRRGLLAQMLWPQIVLDAPERSPASDAELVGCGLVHPQSSAALALRQSDGLRLQLGHLPPHPAAAVSGLGSVLLATLVIVVALQRPKGSQPATYGHLQTLVDLVDDWHLLMFWGDKGLAGIPGASDTRHAGTSALPLGNVVSGTHYLGTAQSG